jgi:hypothetical protein
VDGHKTSLRCSGAQLCACLNYERRIRLKHSAFYLKLEELFTL